MLTTTLLEHVTGAGDEKICFVFYVMKIFISMQVIENTKARIRATKELNEETTTLLQLVKEIEDLALG